MMNDIITVDEKGTLALAAMDAWEEYAARHNIKNPLNQRLGLLDKYSKKLPDGSYTILMEDEYSDEDKELSKQLTNDKYTYMRARDRFEAEWLAAHGGWEVGYSFAVIWDNDWNDLLWFFEEKFKPCEFGECNIFCKNFNNCIKEGFFEWN